MSFEPHCASIGKRRLISALLASGIAVAYPALATDSGLHGARLAALLRQIDVLERLAQDSEAIGLTSDGRYHFDYVRLRADIARMRAGIEDYLSPPRAQPRDLSFLHGTYRRDVSVSP